MIDLQPQPDERQVSIELAEGAQLRPVLKSHARRYSTFTESDEYDPRLAGDFIVHLRVGDQEYGVGDAPDYTAPTSTIHPARVLGVSTIGFCTTEIIVAVDIRDEAGDIVAYDVMIIRPRESTQLDAEDWIIPQRVCRVPATDAGVNQAIEWLRA